ncbi:TPA: valine--tRNA ligase [Candidatus Campbellbacteria bacterium]|nr:MAG: valyl-tRNA synthetase, valyl-tRNA synthetase [Candidatus Campbellbacteria bacterium GW2011_OD1_34_28]KKP74802.1 MAG: Valine-tRNA ligase [Candidatus Campbellbacteria bacterium GW2011_GWD2_35_24]KKP75688.1 MAG: valyl-tRNA synthetase, valyl-tRNA synthetase [Candidatus Campbellbacteria bacterium GW2011_GWC2_35_28]KKP77064.1 MAG: Valine-tRNA ligase [Candidatus Campbellbacteria bacterium GW2011_GWC1_35_31]KKP78990.1 MAG: Valine-tRNA ligase [Candidatus Campbellbacteria bacterium GW2011_GWD1_35
MTTNEKFLKPYEPKEVEEKIYKTWEESGFFNPDNLPGERTEQFSIVLPPPNVTGKLHIGHANMLAIEDTIVRFQRMLGKKTLWLPGTDHAAIATQTKVEKLLAKDGIKKHDLGRDEFLKKVNEFALDSQNTIISQTKRMGSSLDWSRLAFTLDEQRNLAVKTAFKKMYDDGLIYRGEKVVNWDPKGQTVISDDEIVYEERTAVFYTFKYSADFPIAISTTRPETKVGDTAVAVNPDDERYKKYIGQTFEIADFCGTPLSIKIIADYSVDKEFGTGALGVTPAHSKIDEMMAIKNNLPMKKVINEYAKIENAGDILNGKKVGEAKEIIVNWLKENNLMIEEEETQQNVSTAERTGAVIEPLPKLQWFIDVNKKFKLPHSNLKGIKAGDEVSLKDLMKYAVESSEIQILPDRFNKIYYHWIENLRDWCISRQIWYGHRIPVWYASDKLQVTSNKKDEIYVGVDAPEGDDWIQDSDTLDTWFSSGLWTFSTLGWPNETNDLKLYHPTDLLETGHDILFFWVARMILMTTYLTGEIPFKTVYLHGLVRDEKNRKFSKSLGNAIDPLDIIEKYGTDALRMSLIVAVAPGQDIRFSEEKTMAYKKFANKLWNIARFVYSNTENFDYENFDVNNLADYEKNILAKFDDLISEITEEMKEYKLYLTSEKLYHFVWHEMADVILEESKDALADKTSLQDKANKQFMLLNLFEKVLKTLHPFMPYITEEIWTDFPKKQKNLLVVEKWPTT